MGREAVGGETTGQAFDEFSEINMLGGFGGGIKMSAHAKLLFMQKKIKQEIERERANNNETLRRQVDSRGPLACWSCCRSIRDWQAADVHALMLVLHRLGPTGILFYSTVKMPPWPCGKTAR